MLSGFRLDLMQWVATFAEHPALIMVEFEMATITDLW